MCGEYGDLQYRPHFHACIFNHDFSDKKFWKKTKSGSFLYTSNSLESLWPFGYSSIGDVTFESAAYCARYICKKVVGDEAKAHYLDIAVVDESTGEVFEKKPEFTNMSRKPGIGYGWFEKYCKSTYSRDSVVVRGREMKPPKYYDSKYELLYPDRYVTIKAQRVSNALKYAHDNTPERLAVREICANSKFKLFSRQLE
jgi:hypothetical protein